MSICFHPSRPRPLIPRRPNSNPFLRQPASSHCGILLLPITILSSSPSLWQRFYMLFLSFPLTNVRVYASGVDRSCRDLDALSRVLLCPIRRRKIRNRSSVEVFNSPLRLFFHYSRLLRLASFCVLRKFCAEDLFTVLRIKIRPIRGLMSLGVWIKKLSSTFVCFVRTKSFAHQTNAGEFGNRVPYISRGNASSMEIRYWNGRVVVWLRVD